MGPCQSGNKKYKKTQSSNLKTELKIVSQGNLPTDAKIIETVEKNLNQHTTVKLSEQNPLEENQKHEKKHKSFNSSEGKENIEDIKKKEIAENARKEMFQNQEESPSKPQKLSNKISILLKYKINFK